MEYRIGDKLGQLYDARIDLDGSAVVLHSRGGSTGGNPPRNTGYEHALRTIIRRLLNDVPGGPIMTRVLIDSAPSRALPPEDRVLVSDAEVAGLPFESVVSLIRRRAKAFGQQPGTTGGNSTKQLRIETRLSPSSVRAALQLRRWPSDREATSAGQQRASGAVAPASSPHAATRKQAEDALSDVPHTEEELSWAEGDLRIVLHLKTERKRDSDAAKKKRSDMIAELGRLVCEWCGEDFCDAYGPEVAAGVFEIHHTIPLATMSGGHRTVVEDLECLCATCHRATHRKMTLEKT